FPGNIRELENLVRRLIVLRDPRYVLSELKDRTAPSVPDATAAAAVPAPLPSTMRPPAPVVPTPPGYSYAYASPFNTPSPLPPPLIPPPPSSGGAYRGAQAIADAAGAQVAAESAETDDYRIDLKDLGRKAAHAAERE